MLLDILEVHFWQKTEKVQPYELGKSVLLQEGEEILFIGYGNGVGRAEQVAKLVEVKSCSVRSSFCETIG